MSETAQARMRFARGALAALVENQDGGRARGRALFDRAFAADGPSRRDSSPPSPLPSAGEPRDAQDDAARAAMPPPDAAADAGNGKGAPDWRPSPIPSPSEVTGEDPAPPAKRTAADALDLRGPTSRRFGGSLPFFQVDTPKPAAPEPEVPVDEDRGPDSGLIDIRGMTSLEEKVTRENRADADLFNLSGGLFGPTPFTQLNPPDMSALGDAEDRGSRAVAGGRVAPVLPASAVPLAPGSMRPPDEENPFAKRGGMGVRIGLGVVGAVTVVVLALKLGQSFGGHGTEGEATSAPTSTSVATAAPREGESRPSPPPVAAEVVKTAKAVDPGTTATATPTATVTAAAAAAAAATGTPAAAAPGAGATPGAAAGAQPAKPASTAGTQAGAGALTPPPTAAPPPPPPPSPAAAPFDVGAAKAALVPAVLKASACRKPEDPAGGAKVSITFAPSGRVTSARVSGPPFAGTATGGCIAAAFRGVSIPPFAGDPVSVTKEVSVR
jgi:hypothetical protein